MLKDLSKIADQDRANDLQDFYSFRVTQNKSAHAQQLFFLLTSEAMPATVIKNASGKQTNKIHADTRAFANRKRNWASLLIIVT